MMRMEKKGFTGGRDYGGPDGDHWRSQAASGASLELLLNGLG